MCSTIAAMFVNATWSWWRHTWIKSVNCHHFNRPLRFRRGSGQSRRKVLSWLFRLEFEETIRKDGLRSVWQFPGRRNIKRKRESILCSARDNYGCEKKCHFLTFGLFVSETLQKLPTFPIGAFTERWRLQVHGKRKERKKERKSHHLPRVSNGVNSPCETEA